MAQPSGVRPAEFPVDCDVSRMVKSERRDACQPRGCVLPMPAQTLNCPNCGAAISSDAPQCQYCESKLASVACPSCFGMMFIGIRHCPHCGATAGAQSPAQLSVLKCARCRIDMASITLGSEAMRECAHCG